MSNLRPLSERPAARASRAVIYARMSLDTTGEGKGIERQVEDCRALARLRGWEVVAVESDNSVSAYSGKHRPGWGRVKSMVADGAADIIVAWRLDRITRKTSELLSVMRLVQDAGASVVTTDGDLDLTTPTGRAMAKVLATFGEMEVEVKGQRQQRANQQRAQEGKPWRSGWRPFGYDLDGTTREAEAVLIRQAGLDVLAGKALREVAREWQASGLSTERTKLGATGWTHTGVRNVLLAPRNAGWLTYRGEIVARGNWKPIFTDSEHAALVTFIRNGSRRTNGNVLARGRKPSTLLSKIAVCADCGETVSGGGMNGEPIYQCPGYHVQARRAEIDPLVINSMRAALSTGHPGAFLPLLNGPDGSDLLAQIERERQKLSDYGLALARGDLDQLTVTAATREIRTRIEGLEAQLAGSGTAEGLPQIRVEQLDQFDSLDLAGQRRVLERLAVVTLYPRRRKKNVPADQQVTVFLRQQSPKRDQHPMMKALRAGARSESGGALLPEGQVPGERLIPVLNQRAKDLDANR